MVIAVVAVPTNVDGPTRKAKLVFLVAAVLHLVNDLPTFIWTQVLPGLYLTAQAFINDVTAGCPIKIASWLDILSLFNFVSIILFFLFIRWEFLRNMEEVIWEKVNQIQVCRVVLFMVP